MAHLFFEFHCSSLDNERGIASGHNDPDLSPTGKRAAEDMGQRYRSRKIEAVYSSDLLRARRTAELAFGARGIPITYDERLRECDYGEMNGQLAKDMHRDRAQYVAKRYPGGESWASAALRTIRMFNDIRDCKHAGNIVIIGHSATYYALESFVGGTKVADLVAAPWPWKPVWEWEGTL